MTQEELQGNDSDITLTESFWRDAYPTADDAEIAQRLTIRSQQIIEHMSLCLNEIKQDLENLKARTAAMVNEAVGADDDDSDDSDDGTEYVEWDDQGNVIARGWNAHPDRCVHCGAWGEDDHMLSCPEHITQLLASRTVISTFIDEDEGITVKTLSPLPIRLIQPVFDELVAAGYTGTNAGPGLCVGCGKFDATGMDYSRPSFDPRYFTICLDCSSVHEQVTERFAAPKPFEAVITPDPIAQLLASRTVIESDAFEADHRFNVLSPLPISVIQPSIMNLIEAGYQVSHTGTETCKG